MIKWVSGDISGRGMMLFSWRLRYLTCFSPEILDKWPVGRVSMVMSTKSITKKSPVKGASSRPITRWLIIEQVLKSFTEKNSFFP